MQKQLGISCPLLCGSPKKDFILSSITILLWISPSRTWIRNTSRRIEHKNCLARGSISHMKWNDDKRHKFFCCAPAVVCVVHRTLWSSNLICNLSRGKQSIGCKSLRITLADVEQKSIQILHCIVRGRTMWENYDPPHCVIQGWVSMLAASYSFSKGQNQIVKVGKGGISKYVHVQPPTF